MAGQAPAWPAIPVSKSGTGGRTHGRRQL